MVLKNNQIWSYSGNSIEGLVSAKDGTSLGISDSLFIGNTVDDGVSQHLDQECETPLYLFTNGCLFLSVIATACVPDWNRKWGTVYAKQLFL